MKQVKRSLYECSHARVSGSLIRCRRGHRLLPRTDDGSIDIKRLARGAPLEFKVCQKCPDFDSMGPSLPPEERGWTEWKMT